MKYAWLFMSLANGTVGFIGVVNNVVHQFLPARPDVFIFWVAAWAAWALYRCEDQQGQIERLKREVNNDNASH